MPFKIIWKLLKWRHCSVSAGSDNENYLTQLKFIFYKMLEVSHEEYQCAIIETQVCNAQKRQSYIKEYWVSHSSPENRIHKEAGRLGSAGWEMCWPAEMQTVFQAGECCSSSVKKKPANLEQQYPRTEERRLQNKHREEPSWSRLVPAAVTKTQT